MAIPVDRTLKAWIALSFIRGMGGETARKLLQTFGSPEAIFDASGSQLSPFAKPEIVTQIKAGIPEDLLTETLTWVQGEHNFIVTLADADYPKSLLNTSSPPMLLYVKGRLDLLNTTTIGVVGSRGATKQGLSNAEAFAQTLSEAGLCVISGLAHGIDAAAHRGALKGKGSTVAVVGTGLDRVYPAANRDLAHAIAEQGTLISEFPLGTAPLAANFPRRNRIISGMSLGCLVIEASLNSGSLITARMALEHNREVFAIPGSIHAPQSKGCHALIKQGAKLVESAQDVLDELGNFAERPKIVPLTSENDVAFLDKMGFDPIDSDTLAERCCLTIAELSAMLLELELGGHVSVLPGGLYQRVV